MSPAKKLKARIQAWIKELKTKLAAQSEINPELIGHSPMAYREEMLAKYYHLMPRGF